MSYSSSPVILQSKLNHTTINQFFIKGQSRFYPRMWPLMSRVMLCITCSYQCLYVPTQTRDGIYAPRHDLSARSQTDNGQQGRRASETYPDPTEGTTSTRGAPVTRHRSSCVTDAGEILCRRSPDRRMRPSARLPTFARRPIQL